MNKLPNAKGFTLVEMIMVIIILGVLSVSLSRFLNIGTKIYVQSSDRDQLISNARFAIERLNRELRLALPNSPRIIADDQCLEFRPIKASASYLDIPVAPEPASDEVTVVRFDDSEFSTDLTAAVYPLDDTETYGVLSKKIKGVDRLEKKVNKQWTITLSERHLFEQDSPTQRIYFIDDPVAFCFQDGLEGKQLVRYQNYYDYNAEVPDGTAVLMAEYLDGRSFFRVSNPSQYRNGQVQVYFHFVLKDEEISFSNDIQVANVP
ncbi:PulJ/GspJ family protein [Thalassotalea ganghwensis]